MAQDEIRYVIPTQITVDVAPFASVDEALAAKDTVNWRSEPDRAQAVTLAFAAHELQSHLEKIGISAALNQEDGTIGQKSFRLLVETEDSTSISTYELDAQAFSIRPSANGITISSTSRIGVLYGVYRLLDHLGFAWHDPEEVLNPNIGGMTEILWQEIIERPRMKLRGFWTGHLDPPLPDAFALWMARNRLNLGGSFNPNIQGLLGHQSWIGDHDLLQEVFSEPGLFEAHPNWFSEINGKRQKIVFGEGVFNPAFAEPDAASHMAEKLLERLISGDMQHVDIVNIWPTDSRFSNFDQSLLAKKTGNEADNLLAFTTRIAEAFKIAYENGRINRPVTVAGISYLVTMQPPLNSAPSFVTGSRHHIQIIYPIDRDWTALAGESYNNPRLKKIIETWQSTKAARNGVVEYYNMSAYGGLGLTNLAHIGADFATIAGINTDLTAWMHPTATGSGPRRIIDAVISKLAWESANETSAVFSAQLEARARASIKRYFEQRFGNAAQDWQAVSLSVASALENSNQMFGSESLTWIVLQDLIWGSPFYDLDERADFARGFIDGGLQALPVRFSDKPDTKASFMGLRQSKEILENAYADANRILSVTPDPKIKQRMQSDLIWFETSLLRHRLLLRSAERLMGVATEQSLASALADADALLAAPVFNNTFMSVDQKIWVERHQEFLRSPLPSGPTLWQRLRRGIAAWF